MTDPDKTPPAGHKLITEEERNAEPKRNAKVTVGKCGCGRTVLLIEVVEQTRARRYLVETLQTSVIQAPAGNEVSGHPRHQCAKSGIFRPDRVVHDG